VKLFGLTGGIGMGKSACAAALVKTGIHLVDTDHLAHDLTQPGRPALAEISSAFGASIVDGSGRLDRGSLAHIVFGDASARQRLEGILHPKITAAWTSEVDRWRAAGAPLGVVVVPLLFETRAEARFDATVCVACSRVTQANRLRARGWSDQEAARRIAAQMPIEQKIERADNVIWSEGSLELLAEQAQRIFR
jgi:dephospho-CoA kinase